MISLLFSFFALKRADAAGFFYVEEVKDGRIYVFADQKNYKVFQQTGELEIRVTRVGAGPNGETIIADSEDALQLYYFKHNLPSEVIEKPSAAPAPAMQEKLPYKFSGLMFGDYFYNISRDPGIGSLSNVALAGPKDFNGFLLRRAYFTFDLDLAKSFTTRFRLEADSASLDSKGKITTFVKDAWIKWAGMIGSTDFIFGIQPTPAYDVSEGLWAYRSLEKTIMDLRGIVPSRDFGVSLKGKIDGGGKFHYWFDFGNGSGNAPEQDKFKRVMGHVEFQPNSHWTFTFYQDFRAAQDIASPIIPDALLNNNSTVTAWFADYGTKDKFNLGYEGFYQNFQHGFTIPTDPAIEVKSRQSIGHSFWAWYNFNPKFGVVGRFDYFDPNTDKLGILDNRNLFIAALVMKPVKNVWIMPNLYVESYGTNADVNTKTSVTGRATLYWYW
jgi:hypothetical protein